MRARFFSAIFASTLISWALSSPGMAEEQEDPQGSEAWALDGEEQEEASSSQTVRTTSRIDGVMDGRARRVQRISGRVLERRGATDLAQALEWLSEGSSVSPTGGSQGLLLDGLPTSQLVVLRDGLPVARPVGSPQGPLVDLSSIPLHPGTIERIDIYRGMGPVGSGDAGGLVIDIVTRRSRSKTSVFAQGLMGSARDSMFRRNVSAGAQVGISRALSLDLLGQYSAFEAIDVNGDATPDSAERANLQSETSLTWRSEGGSMLRAQLLASEGSALTYGGPTAALDDEVERQTYRGRLRGRWWLHPDVRLDHHTDLGRSRHIFQKRVRESGFPRPKADTIHDELRQSLLGTWFLSSHDLALELMGAGRDIEREGETGTLEPIRQGEWGIGLGDTWYLSEDWELFGRVFWGDATNYDGALQGQLAFSWKLAERWAWRGSLAQTRRLPTPEELYLFFDHSEVGYRVTGNEDLAPETLRSWESGLVWSSASRQLGVELQGFYHELFDAIVTEGTPEDPSLFTYTNAARAHTAGARLTAQLRRLPGRLQLLANYTLLPLAHDRDTGERLPLRPLHSARVELRGTWWSDRIEAWTDLSTRSSLVVPEGSAAAPAFALLGFGVGYRYREHVQVLLDLNNLLDQTNSTWGPIPGRHGFLSLRLGYDAP